MTEDEARDKAQGLARCMGIAFYVVRSSEGDIVPVQVPSDDCDILARVPPPLSPHDQGLTVNPDSAPRVSVEPGVLKV
jgi:hypothetical protein